jgi:hypothetical protein
MQTSRNKRIIVSILAIVLLLAIGLGNFSVIRAYYSDADEAYNRITLGHIDFEIVEDFDPQPVEPGSVSKKEVTILNTGNVPVYVRVQSNVSNETIKANLTIDYNLDDWTYSNNYWYYKDPIQPGESTLDLFTTVTVNDDADPDILSDFQIYIIAEVSASPYSYS